MDDKKKKRPKQVELTSEALVIYWRDGFESRHGLADLRRQCPCATCRALRQEPGVQSAPAPAANELTLLDGAAATATAAAAGFGYVGRYGLRIDWADGHNYGIYTFEALRREAEA